MNNKYMENIISGKIISIPKKLKAVVVSLLGVLIV